MTKHLYDEIAKRWYRGGTIYFYSDPHFSDLDSYKYFRFPEEFDLDDLEGVSEETKNTANKITIEHLDQMQIDNINKVCGKNDTLVILGDIGNIECVRKLKAGYKVLILGNHDRGASYYKRSETPDWKLCPNHKEEIEKFYINNKGYDLMCCDNNGNLMFRKYIDNYLFDEVYEGTLQISPKIILSHEPCNYNYCLNIHGHVHAQKKFEAYCESVTDCQLDGLEIERNVYSLNVCAELLNYKPISLKQIIDMGLLKDVADIHREAINRRDPKENKNDK